jgi:hypothetical protein
MGLAVVCALACAEIGVRVFLTIGHLEHCGINLPAMAHADLSGFAVEHSQVARRIRPTLWVDLLRDLESLVRSAVRVN